ncbi:methionyl-tRNA formyltransferase [Sandaracinobacteroides saxicola]|uniref:Methionyl-tRNA formyltransferase n=1 Tax=Sandaracinobacteroides saxicola TaxID=2759707 RepID=A0A7G5IKQ2_9SPHN|nr:methionyl-tRNA formyltransferase [Sandaracinobacteroides saxicola]QMW23944.1 methionyl-tRNA formyltransferase [Sandaracinobacteroides saxicola]
MRLAFMGTPDFAVPALHALLDAGHQIAAVYCQPPRPGNRGRLQASAVQRAAESLGLPVRTPANFRGDADRAAFAALDLDAAVVAAYGLILPQAILDAPRLGCFNIHASLLPRWRGAAPIQRAILAGDQVTGVTIMQMERGLDTGPMLLTAVTPIAHKTAGALTAELAQLGATLMVQALATRPTPVPQPEDGVTYAHKIDKAEARLDWSEPADAILRRLRAMTPTPGAWFLAGGERVKITDASATPLLPREAESGRGDSRQRAGVGAGSFVDRNAVQPTLSHNGHIALPTGTLTLHRVQPAGGKPMPFADFARGRSFPLPLA